MKELFASPLFLEAISFIAHSAFFCVVFAVASRITLKELLREIGKPALLLKTLAVTGVIVPLVTAGVIRLFDVPLAVGGVILLGAVTEGSPLALLGTKSKKGSLQLASTVMGILILLMPATVTFWLWAYSQWFPLHLSISVPKLLSTVVPLTLVPLFLGVALRELLPAVSDVAGKLLDLYSKACILVLLALFIVPGLVALYRFTFVELASIVVIMSLSLWAGYLLGGPDVRDRIGVALAATECNLTALIVIAHVSYPKAHILGPLLAYVIAGFLVATAWYRFLLYRMKGRGETLDPVPTTTTTEKRIA